jgi:hypothetical protein
MSGARAHPFGSAWRAALRLAAAGGIAAAGAAGAAGQDLDTEAGRLLRFADERFAAGDWYRAATEYLRLASYRPDAAEALEWRLRAARCAFEAERYAQARSEALALAQSAPGPATPFALRARRLAGAAAFRMEAFADAAALAAEGRELAPDEAVAGAFSHLEGWAWFRLERYAAAAEAWRRVPAGGPLGPPAARLAGLADRGARLPARSPAAGALLSAIVPGLGQIAHGFVWDGLSALTLTAASGWLLAEGLRRDSDGLAAGGIAALVVFYPANVLGGANAARRAARRDRADLLDAASTIGLPSPD